MRKKSLSLSLIFALAVAVQGTAQMAGFITPSSEAETAYPSFVFELNNDELKAELETAPLQGTSFKGKPTTIQLPNEHGKMVTLTVIESPIIAPELSIRYPEIKTYKVSGDGIQGRIGYTYKGFHGILFTTQGTLYIDPIEEGGTYHTYHRADYMNYVGDKGHRCAVTHESEYVLDAPVTTQRSGRTGDQLRTYRLALACTGEYAQFHGGTVSGVLSAMVVTMNRVNGVYERDFSVTMEIIGNNDDLIYFNSSTDPYTNNSGFAMLGENQSNVDAVIGSANYDIGHVFSTGGGGVASLESVCNSSNKARGVTGGGSPIGDPFDIDYVAHEMGHQFGGNHTQNNNCNRNGFTAWEPGSASTIMGYAGICSPNLQNNSDDYFHSGNYDEITSHVSFTVLNQGCPSVSNTGNTAPAVTVDSEFYVIPKETPFVLRGTASDAEGDDLSYCWEEMDLGPSGSPTNPSGNAPIFRSWDPVDNGERTFPRLIDVITNNTTIGETYATYSRDLNFRLTVRDNNINGGGVAYDEVAMAVDGNKGPFVVLSPGNNELVQTQTYYQITWDVASTDQSPINCASVHILLYENNGVTFVDTIATSVPNTGSYLAQFPSQTGVGYRVRVEAADNVFFNLNPGVFTLVDPQVPQGAEIILTAAPDFANGSIALNWTDSFSNENFWVIERSVGGNGSFSVIDSVGVNVTSYNDSAVSMFGTEYHYRVYAGNPGGNSSYSNEASWLGVGVDELTSANWLLYPNPAQSSVTLTSANSVSIEQVQVFDETGRLMMDSEEGGRHQMTLDVSAWPNGNYFLHVEDSRGLRAVKRISVAH